MKSDEETVEELRARYAALRREEKDARAALHQAKHAKQILGLRDRLDRLPVEMAAARVALAEADLTAARAEKEVTAEANREERSAVRAEHEQEMARHKEAIAEIMRRRSSLDQSHHGIIQRVVAAERELDDARAELQTVAGPGAGAPMWR